MGDAVEIRLTRLREVLANMAVDGCLVMSKTNRFYLSGFTGSNGYLFITSTSAVLFTDSRYIEQANDEAENFEVCLIRNLCDDLGELVSSTGITYVGFEDQEVSYATYQLIRKDVGESAQLVPLGEAINSLRAIKDRGELMIVERAAAIADEVMAIALSSLKEGVTEKVVAWTIEGNLREFGADGVAFDTIVASGPNASRPHHKTGDRSIQLGDMVVIDMGALYRGYRSDITRTICMGRTDEQFSKIYHVVREAQAVAEELAGPGVKVSALDTAARDVIHSHGYGKYFAHGLGHGIGLDVHELPRVSGSSDEVLSEGMVFTIEPGIYIPGWGGVRIEDMLVIDNGETRILTLSAK